METIMLDSAQSEISTRAKDFLISLFIGEFQSEAYYQYQNFSERRHQTVKLQTNAIIDITGALSFIWLLEMV